jgi:hypothetical protein
MSSKKQNSLTRVVLTPHAMHCTIPPFQEVGFNAPLPPVQFLGGISGERS